MLKISIEKILQRIVLVPKNDILDENYLLNLAKKIGKNVLVCDAPVREAINWERDGNIFYKEIGNVVIGNIDHHFEKDEFYQNISTTNLVIEQVRKYFKHFQRENFVVVINHTDCDAILSALIMIGALVADEKFGKSAVAADHTGEENGIADLLQAMEYERNLELSLRNFQLLLEEEKLETNAQELLNLRIEERKTAEKIVQEGKIKKTKKIYYISLQKRIDPSFFVRLLFQAEIIIVFSPSKQGKTETRVRLGIKAKIKNLYELKISEFDKAFGCRWNAGSNERSGGSKKSEKEYLEYLLTKL